MPDPFQMLGVEPRFNLDRAALEARHRELSKALHPDRYVGAAPAERRLALSRAIDVNEAFRLLKDPLQRAEALLRRAGVATGGEAGEPRPAPALLMEMMELREELAMAGRARDGARVAGLAERMRARETQQLAELGRRLDNAAGHGQTLSEALPVLGELRYIRRFLDEVNAIEEALAP